MKRRPFLILISLTLIVFSDLASAEKASRNPEKEVEEVAFLPKSITKAESALKEKKPDLAISLIEKSLKRIAERYYDRAYLVLGEAFYQSGNYDKAYQYLQNSLRYRARNSDALHYLGDIYKERTDYDKALLSYKEALWFNDYISISPGSTYSQLSAIYLMKNEPEQAKEFLQLAQKQSPEDPAAAQSLARYYAGEGLFQEAAQTLRPLLKNEKIDSQAKMQITMDYASTILRAPNGTFDRTSITGARDLLLSNPSENESEDEEEAELEEAPQWNEYERQKLLARAYLQLSDFKSAQSSIDKARESHTGDDEDLREIEMQYEIMQQANSES